MTHTTTSPDYILELKNITKTFPGMVALDKVNFKVKTGEIHTLMGENGAGKSTLIKIITGVHQPDEGTILLEGKKVKFTTPRHAQKSGITAIYQHATSYPHLTVTENIFMMHEEVAPFTKRLLWKKMHARAQVILDSLGATFSTKAIVGTLSVAQQQMVEIAKALSTHAKIIIMDEPTASLTNKESNELYKITEQLRDQERAIIFVSHKFEDMYRLSSRVTVLRDAKCIGEWDIKDVNTKRIIYAMVGREIQQMYPEKRTHAPSFYDTIPLLQATGLTKTGWFADIDFEVRAGEIVSFTGLIGAGRTEVFQALLGITTLDHGAVFLDGKKIHISHPKEALKFGIGYLPEDRQQQGLILDWSMLYNITLTNINSISTHHWINTQKEIDIAKTLAEKVNVKANTVYDSINSLSGGNQQKVVLAKLLTNTLKIIILDEPTKGVDIGAKSAMYFIMKELVEQGYAIIMISSEMPEVLGMSDRIIVMHEGRIKKTFINEGITQEMILEAAML